MTWPAVNFGTALPLRISFARTTLSRKLLSWAALAVPSGHVNVGHPSLKDSWHSTQASSMGMCTFVAKIFFAAQSTSWSRLNLWMHARPTHGSMEMLPGAKHGARV